jgi:NAD(P)H-dependent FMN reductase
LRVHVGRDRRRAKAKPPARKRGKTLRMPKLQIIVVSTRDGRAGLPVAEWFAARARAHGGFEVDFVDLREVALPLFDEPKHPRFRQYAHDHTKAWSRRVESADAFVFVTPEYNYGVPPSLINALDFLSSEWAYKAAGFVSYGGTSGGTRAVQMAKLVVTSLKIVAIPEAVSIPFFAKLIDAAGVFDGASYEEAAKVMLNELARWTGALGTLRTRN